MSIGYKRHRYPSDRKLGEYTDGFTSAPFTESTAVLTVGGGLLLIASHKC